LTIQAQPGALDEASEPLAPDLGGVPEGVEVVLVSGEQAFLQSVADVLPQRAAVVPVASMALAHERLGVSRRIHVLAVDTRGHTDLRNAIGRTFARAASTVVLLFAEREAEDTLHRAFTGSRVFAILPYPLDPPRTVLTLSEALASAAAKNGAPPALRATAHVK
jgi:hypothetical protein